ncbi:hypothetical protein [Cyanobium sp. Morenito 9A2]|uniref:hypothetical protein n=1 Tax=Cyanobium sp. Morenito 9A2 TaxID=2823718 RepID=UPI0020CC6DD0|nr:hypothetical protein [Cyanobium sp. Morenito 9A2]MCP9850016.1 hypothetical protein [Cyanobium sp. Morenito 9A2]
MTNLQAGASSNTGITGIFTRERLLVGVPAVIGGVVALGFLGLAVVPLWQQVQKDQQQVDDLRQQKESLPLLRNQLAVQQTNEEEANALKTKLLSLIAGSGSMNTFLAQLSAEGLRTGVQLDAFEPIAVAAPLAATTPATPPAPATPPPAGQAAPAAPPDPLLAPGIQKTSLLIGARGRYPLVLAFLRRLESLGLLVVQSDLVLGLEPEQPTSSPSAERVAPRTTLKLNVALYSKAPEPSGGKKP